MRAKAWLMAAMVVLACAAPGFAQQQGQALDTQPAATSQPAASQPAATSQPAEADAGSGDGRPIKSSKPLTFSNQDTGPWGHLAAAVGVVLAVGVVGLIVVRKVLPRLGVVPARGARRMSVLEVLHLGQRRGLYLVRVDGRELLVGDSPSGLSLLTEVEAARQAADDGDAADKEVGFQSVLAEQEVSA
jgi:flagellar biogenesis protein FliO